ncbi:uncharacterized protein LOC117338115 isoform X2 [Pecten maximus]|uniref:uncharacterized protein LOC117338115 isoform X2 n=1 Tax=Pecten maximus TaxID=6579 RepID=UPI001458C094|nr:uncharacterized protein LOC117338115 isoform X2 [Pecten maximus]
MDMRILIFILISFSLEYLTEASGDCGGCFKPPDFTSPYILMEAQTDQSKEIVEHGLNEVPIKVDVQVRAINTTDPVFPGLGSSQRDDDEPAPYGGVVYKYNDISVVLYAPNRNDGSSSGTIIYTGNDTWNGPHHQTEDRAEVRAKVWTNCSFPKPQFDSDWFPMAVNNGSQSFKEIAHGLGTYPEYVSVQIKDKNSNWYSDGIGSAMTVQNLTPQSAWGGVIYGFNESHVRIWVPGFDSGSMYSTADGWGRGSKEFWNEGSVRVRVWSHFKADLIYSAVSLLGNTTRKRHSHHLSTRKGGSMDIDNGMIYVTVKAVGGKNAGFSFPGMGAVQNADPNESFGGLVYAYGPRSIAVWQHVQHDHGYLVYINQNWGGGLMSQKSKNGSMIVRFWEPYTSRCPTSPINHPVTVHLDNGNPTTLSSVQSAMTNTVHLHTTAAPNTVNTNTTASQTSAMQASTHQQSTIGSSSASFLSPAATSEESQGMSGAVLGIIIGACLLVVCGVVTGVICAFYKKKKMQIEDKNVVNE